MKVYRKDGTFISREERKNNKQVKALLIGCLLVIVISTLLKIEVYL